MTIFNQVSIIGVGLMGASLGKTILSRGVANYVVGFDKSQKELRVAEKVQAISMATKSIEQCVENADLIVLATPVKTMPKLVIASAEANTKSALITDVGSSKCYISDELPGVPLPNGCRYLGSHPMAGKETSGAQFADDRLFDNCVTAITPTEQTTQSDIALLARFWQSIGSQAHVVDMVDHDIAVANVSHLPHLLSVAMANTVQSDWDLAMLLASTGLESMTRLAAGPVDVWADILLTNKECASDEADALMTELGTLIDILDNNDRKSLIEHLKRAQAVRSIIMSAKKSN